LDVFVLTKRPTNGGKIRSGDPSTDAAYETLNPAIDKRDLSCLTTKHQAGRLKRQRANRREIEAQDSARAS
jgi:hypothetical protein